MMYHLLIFDIQMIQAVKVVYIFWDTLYVMPLQTIFYIAIQKLPGGFYASLLKFSCNRNFFEDDFG